MTAVSKGCARRHHPRHRQDLHPGRNPQPSGAIEQSRVRDDPDPPRGRLRHRQGRAISLAGGTDDPSAPRTPSTVRGYPKGLKGEESLLEARILAMADTVEAMSSHRPYRPALGPEKALAEIEKNRELLTTRRWWMPASSCFGKGTFVFRATRTIVVTWRRHNFRKKCASHAAGRSRATRSRGLFTLNS